MIRYNNILRPVHDPLRPPHDPLPKIWGSRPPTPQDWRLGNQWLRGYGVCSCDPHDPPAQNLGVATPTPQDWRLWKQWLRGYGVCSVIQVFHVGHPGFKSHPWTTFLFTGLKSCLLSGLASWGSYRISIRVSLGIKHKFNDSAYCRWFRLWIAQKISLQTLCREGRLASG